MINENIKHFRKTRGMSQEEMAVKLNVVRQTVSKWEKGLSGDSDNLPHYPILLTVFVQKPLSAKSEDFPIPLLSEPTLPITLFFFIIFICVEIVFLVTDNILANFEVVMDGSSDISSNISDFTKTILTLQSPLLP